MQSIWFHRKRRCHGSLTCKNKHDDWHKSRTMKHRDWKLEYLSVWIAYSLKLENCIIKIQFCKFKSLYFLSTIKYQKSVDSIRNDRRKMFGVTYNDWPPRQHTYGLVCMRSSDWPLSPHAYGLVCMTDDNIYTLMSSTVVFQNTGDDLLYVSKAVGRESRWQS